MHPRISSRSLESQHLLRGISQQERRCLEVVDKTKIVPPGVERRAWQWDSLEGGVNKDYSSLLKGGGSEGKLVHQPSIQTFVCMELCSSLGGLEPHKDVNLVELVPQGKTTGH